MNLARSATLLAAAALLASCGSDDSEPAATTPSTPTPAATTPEATETETETTDTASSPAGTTQPGTELAVGDTAKVEMTLLDEGLDSKNRYRVDVTVTKIEKKSISDMKNIDLDAKQKESTPYFVSAKITNAGKKLPGDEDPDLKLQGIDDRGQEQSNIIFIGDFPPCDDIKPPKAFGKGKSYTTCHVFLVPGGGSIDEVHWQGTSEYLSDPVVWK